MKPLLRLALLVTCIHCSLGRGAPQTLLEMSNVKVKPSLKKSILLLVDYQKEYTTGRLPLWRVESTVKNTQILLDIVRKHNVPVIHVIHDGGTGGLFDLSQKGGQMIDSIKPIEGEVLLQKRFPNAFYGTELAKIMSKYPERNQLIVAGLMTHMCIASTVSSAIEHGYFTTVIASTTTTRDLKGAGGEVISARSIKNATLATIKDRFSNVLNSVYELQE